MERNVFSGEKFNIDGSDGLGGWCHNLRGESRRFQTRKNGGGSLMIWGAISAYGLSPIAFLNGKQDSAKYCESVQLTLLPWAAEVFGEQRVWRLQQNNATIHTSNYTRQWMTEKGIRVLPRPASEVSRLEYNRKRLRYACSPSV